MKMFINKNGQQHGPFDEAKVLEMLRAGQISGNDFGIKDGQQKWQKLGEMFSAPKQSVTVPPVNPVPQQNVPTPQFDRKISPTPQKSGSSKGLMFGLIGCGGLILLSLIGLAGYFAFGKKSSTEFATDTNTNSNTKTAPPIPTDFTSMKDKAEELAKLSPPLKLDPKLKIKGKVALVEKGKYAAEVKGFDAYYKQINETDLASYGLTKEMLAFKPEEIEILIQTICTKGKPIGRYEQGVTGYANNCKVSLTDYKNNVIFAQKTFINAKPDKSISSVYAGSKEFIALTPFTEIQDYVKSFVPEKVEVSSAAELPEIDQPVTLANSAEKFARLAFPIKLDTNAKIKGKVLIIDKSSISTAYVTGLDRDLGRVSDPMPSSIILTKEGLGIADNQIALKSSEIETLIQVSCKRGTLITKVKGVSVFSSVCEVNVIDYKALTTIAQKTFEGKKFDAATYSDPSMYEDKTDEVSFPREEIYEYIKLFPK
jgi:GYF domain 2